MRDQCVEIPISQHRHYDFGGARRKPDRSRESFLLDLEQFRERAIRTRDLGHGCRVLRVVEMQKVDAVQAQRFKAFLQ